MDSEIRLLLEEKKLSSHVIGALGHLGITDLATLAHIEASEDKFRAMIEREMRLKTEDGMSGRVLIAKLIGVWHYHR